MNDWPGEEWFLIFVTDTRRYLRLLQWFSKKPSRSDRRIFEEGYSTARTYDANYYNDKLIHPRILELFVARI
ncbi:MAG: hypothetical protein DLM72_02845 [Candidatus Nitrosopolaris wilkensis]|nr:MAG: hypothetical protein DLM72_02845 [Candidatus Nitrosopolaris wilkensis]